MSALEYALALASGLRRAMRLYAREAVYAAAAAIPHPGWHRGRHRVRRGHMSTGQMVECHAQARALSEIAIRRITDERSLVPLQMRKFLELEAIP